MSDNVIRPEAWITNGQASLEVPQPINAPDEQVASGGGGPHDPGMEARMQKVEAGLDDVRATLGRMEGALSALATRADVAKLDDRFRKLETEGLPKIAVELAEVKGKVSQLPTTTAIFVYMGGLVTLVIAIGGVAFGILRAAGH